MSKTGIFDEKWKILFEKHQILQKVAEKGVFKIKAREIKEVYEPRLMTKFDHKVNLPEPFRKNDLSILPISRGSYVISHFDAYHALEQADGPVHRFSLPSYIQSLDSSRITSEAVALNCAAAAGVIEDFMGEDSENRLVYPTVSGRMGSGNFSFRIHDTKTGAYQKVDVKKSQIEIDAAYEGLSCLALVEAKMDLSEDFLIRQLYYPYRVWENRISKPVKTVFMIYSNGIFRLYEYAFADPSVYSSLELVRQRLYSVEDTTISASEIETILHQTEPDAEPAIPFPQADKFERVINLCELLKENDMSKAEVTAKYDFDARQTNYYTDAARYLGLLDKEKKDGITCYHISKEGCRILRLGYKQRQLEFCRRILSHRAFHQSLSLYFHMGTMPSKDSIVEIMRQSGLHNVRSDETFSRRASTIKGWLNWIVSLVDE